MKGNQLGELGAFVVASALASVLSTYVWGRLSDRSSRKVLIRAALIAALALAGTATLGFLAPDPAINRYALPALLFVLMVAYQGVRLGRSTHLVDMADEDTRAAYTALSNTMIGVVLVAGSAFGLLASVTGPATVLATFCVMCVLAAMSAARLDEVQKD